MKIELGKRSISYDNFEMHVAETNPNTWYGFEIAKAVREASEFYEFNKGHVETTLENPEVTLNFRHLSFWNILKLIGHAITRGSCTASGNVVANISVGNLHTVYLNKQPVWRKGQIIIDPQNRDLK